MRCVNTWIFSIHITHVYYYSSRTKMVKLKLVSIMELDNLNYKSRKFKVRMLHREGTWKCVQEALPTDPSNEWIKQDEKAQSTISLTISDNQIAHNHKCETTDKQWGHCYIYNHHFSSLYCSGDWYSLPTCQ